MRRSPLTVSDASSLERCVRDGGVALFPADTVYGLCCDPENRSAAKRLYELKGRDAERPAAVMFFALERALTALPELEERERRAIEALLPGPVTLLLPNRARRFQAAGGTQGDTLGLRVPRLDAALSALGSVALAVMQSSANLTGGPDASRVADVPASVRDGADLVLDAGDLPGTPSSVVDLSSYASDRTFSVVRAGALSDAVIARARRGSLAARGSSSRASLDGAAATGAEVESTTGKRSANPPRAWAPSPRHPSRRPPCPSSAPTISTARSRRSTPRSRRSCAESSSASSARSR